jgi:hypothetical protein
MIYQQFLVGLGIFIYIWLTIDIPMQRRDIELNTLNWEAPRIYWAWGLLYGWQYMFLTFKKKLPFHRKCTTLIGITLYIVFSIIMLKRQMIVELAMVSVFKVLYHVKEGKINIIKWLTVFAAMTVVIFSIFHFDGINSNIDYFDKIYLRSKEKGSLLDTLLSNTRLYATPMNIYNQATFLELLYGQGLGSGVLKDGILDTVVESGLLTIFMKGGIAYLIIWYCGFLFITLETFLVMKGEKVVFGLLSVMFIFSSPMAPFLIDYPSSGYQMFWLGRSASRIKEFET